MVNAEMIEGYWDGRDSDSPVPSDNRSQSYMVGFKNGRDDLRRQPRDSAANIRKESAAAIAADLETQTAPASEETGAV